MNCPVYTFGPNAHPSTALSLRDAIAETFPSFKFDVEMTSGLSGLRESVVLCGPTNSKAFERMVMFARGFVAGFGGGVTPPTKLEAQRRTQTRADCPVAKRKSDPPPPSNRGDEPTLPSQPSPVLKRRNTIVGIPIPALRLATNS